MVIDNLVVQQSKGSSGAVIHDTSTGDGVVIPAKQLALVARRLNDIALKIDPNGSKDISVSIPAEY